MEVLPHGFYPHLIDHLQLKGGRDQDCSFYSFYDKAWKEMGEMKVENCQSSLSHLEMSIHYYVCIFPKIL